MNKISRAVILFIAQGAYSGRSPFAPGTAGTLVGILLYLGVKNLSLIPYGILCVILCGIGTYTAGKAECMLGSKDSPSIVIDEIAGYLIAMFMVPSGWGYVAVGFFLFRLFDVVKPWPLFGLQKVRGGLGVMLDDIGAGVYTNVALQIAAYYKIF
ncbi:MAG TPA: phosphatidylglycerophosphatase A [Nitrospirota bacterium]|nr:phosphatidylglycerophosphatase A [Nitrospirota bacterium]